MNKQQKRPNILLVHADQHRIDCIGAYGNKDVYTPNIDRLAEDGILFKNSFCPYPICTPSRYSLLTGLYVHQHQGWTNHSNIPEGLDTLPSILKDAGYKTKAIGKMHFTPKYLDIGFEELELAEGVAGKGTSPDKDMEYTRYLREKGLLGRGKMPGERDNFGAVECTLDEKDHVTTWTADRAIETIEEWADGGNFLMVGFNRPHRPFDPPARWREMYNPDKLSLLPGWSEQCLPHDMDRGDQNFSHDELTEEKCKEVMSYYYGCISQVDYHVGRMISLLKEKGIYDQTMIIYTSDHGEFMGFHHLMGKINYMYDPIVKTPLIIKYPEQKNAGEIYDGLVNNVDLAPTILRQAGCKLGQYMVGTDLAENDSGSKYVFAEKGRGNEYMIRTTERKLILCKDRRKSQFFDLEKDPYEMNNIINNPDYQKDLQEMENALMRWILFETPTPVHLNHNAKEIER